MLFRSVVRRIISGLFIHAEVTHVAHHGEDVFIDGINVKQIELHQAFHGAEGRQVSAQQAVTVHASQFVADMARLADNFHEQAAIADVSKESPIHHDRVFAYQADGAGAHPLDGRVLDRKSVV